MLLAGKERVAREGAAIGFHSATMPGVEIGGPSLSILNDTFVTALHRVGVDEDFIQKAIGTSSKSIWLPDLRTLVDQNVLTRIVSRSGEGFGLGTDELKRQTMVELRRSILEDTGSLRRAFNALARAEPAKFESAIQSAYQTLQKGQDMRSSMNGLAVLYRQATSARFSVGGDRAMHQWAVLNLRLLRDNMETSPRATLMRVLLDGEASSWEGATLLQHLPKYPQQEYNLFMALLLEESPVATGALDAFNAHFELTEAFAASVKSEEDRAVCAKMKSYKSFDEPQTKRACQVFLNFYITILRFPLEKQGRVMRAYLRPQNNPAQ